MNKKIIPALLTVLFLSAFAWYGYENSEIFSIFTRVSIFVLLLIAIGKTSFHFFNGLFTKWTVEEFTRNKLTVGEGYYIGILNAIGNFFGPLLGGTSIRAVYLKKVHKLPYGKFTATLVSYYLILFSMICMLAVICVLLLGVTPQTIPLLLFFSVWLLLMVVLSISRLPRSMINKLNSRYTKKVIEIIYSIEDGWRTIARNKILVLRLMGLALFSYLATFAITLIEFQATGISISIPSAGLYSVLITVSMLVSFTPGAIGIREAMLLAVTATLGVTEYQVLQVAVLDRAVTFGLLLVMFMLTRSGRLKKQLTSKDIIL
jgi:uncharacterized protein (TIRG00374 family)